MVPVVHKTTVYLPLGLKEALTRTARDTGTSEAELIRQAIADKVARENRPRPRVPISSRGIGDPTAAERVDELLTGFGRS